MSRYQSASLVRIYLILLISIFQHPLVFSQANQESFDVISYNLQIEFFPAEEQLAGKVTLLAQSLENDLNQVTLDLMPEMQVDSISGQAVRFQHEANLLTLTLDRGYNPPEKFAVTIFYHGQPGSDKFFKPVVFSHRRGKYETETISTESCPYYARYWWPCKDTPADKPDSVHLFITVPENLDVAANGAFVKVVKHENHTCTHHWHIKNPIATYLITVQITDYAQFSDIYVNAAGDTMDLMYFVFPEDSARAYPFFMKTRRMLEILTQYYGEYPYLNEKYGMAEYIGEWAAMEYQTLSCFSPAFIQEEITILHELAHQWFGDCVTPANFHHSWISEGFATYSEALYQEHLLGKAAYHDYMNGVNDAHNYHVPIYRDDISEPSLVYHGVVYNKGAWVLHMLRHILGDTTFFQALRAYLQQFGYGSAVTEDLQQVFEAVSGIDLNDFFQQWIYESWYPEYLYGWSVNPTETGQYHLTGFIDQKQTEGPAVFKMPLDITVKFANGDTTFVQIVDEQGEILDYLFDQQPLELLLDRDNWVLKTARRMQIPQIEYIRYWVDDQTGDKNGRPDPGETVALFVSLLNIGIPINEVRGILSTSDPTVTLLVDSVGLGTLPHRVEQTNQDQPFQLKIKSHAQGHLGRFQLKLAGAGNYRQELSFNVKIGRAQTLFIDDDQGKAYEKYIEPLFDDAGIYANTWHIACQGTPTDQFRDYNTIIWLTGDSRDSTLTEPEQTALQNFLNNGGKLLISGQNIGYDLVEQGSDQDSLFYTTVLKATYQGDSSGAVVAMSQSNAPLARGMQLFFNSGPSGAKNQTSTDLIRPIEPAASFLIYLPGNTPAGIYYHHPENDSRLVYLAFGLEGISGPLVTTASTFLAKIYEWLNGLSSVPEYQVFETLPEFFDLSQNYPNPFNPQTTVEYQVPEPCLVQLAVYNLLGQKVRILINTHQNSGYHKTHWDGRDDFGEVVATGIYLMHFKAGNYREIKKMMIIR